MKIAIIGAAGRTGLALIKACHAREASNIQVIAVVRTSSRLSAEIIDQIAVVVEGDATSPSTVSATLAHSPDYIICAVGAAKISGVQTIRGDVTKAYLAGISNSNNQSVRFVAISSNGVGDSINQVNFFVRIMLTLLLKRVLQDHTEQERLVTHSLPENRWLIVRPTGLKDIDGARKIYQLVTGTDKVRSTSIGRHDVAHFILSQILGEGDEGSYWGKAVTITW